MRRLSLALAVLFAPAGAWAGGFPTFVDNGASAVTASTGTCTPTMPGSILAEDLLLLVATSENQAITLSTANGFAELTGSPQSAGTAAVDPGQRTAVFWRKGAGSAPVVADSGDHTTCAVHRFRGVRWSSGNFYDVTAAGNDSAANDTSASIPGATTTVANTLVVLIQGTSFNGTGTTNCGAVTNANLASITERFDSSNTSGLGGGHCIITGTKAATGAYAASTLTMANTTFKGAFSIALAPETTFTETFTEAVTAANSQTDALVDPNAITRDGSSAFPILAGNSGTLTSVTTGTFNVAAGSVIVVTTGYENVPGTAVSSLTVSWAAGGTGTKPTFTKRSEAASTPTTNGFSSIWTATATDALSGVAVTSAAGASSGTAILTVGVDALTHAVESGGASNSVFHSGSGANNVTVNGITARSWVYVAQWSENGTADSPVANTTELREDAVGGSNRSAVGVNTTGTSGNISVGWSATDSYNGVAAYEILRATPGGGATYTESFTEAVSAADSSTLQGTYSSTFSEGVSAADSLAQTRIANQTTSEAASPGDSLVVGQVMPQVFTEAANAADSMADTLVHGTVFTESFSESASASDGLAQVQVFAVSLTEAANAGDAAPAGQVMPQAFTEASSASDSLTHARVSTQVFTEAAAAGDSLAQAGIFSSSFTEPVSTGDAAATTMLMPQVFTEPVTLAYTSTDSLVPGGGGATYFDSFTESTSLGDSLVQHATFANGFTEPVSAGAGGNGMLKVWDGASWR